MDVYVITKRTESWRWGREDYVEQVGVVSSEGLAQLYCENNRNQEDSYEYEVFKLDECVQA